MSLIQWFKIWWTSKKLIPIANYQTKKHEVTVISSSNETFNNEKFKYINIFFIIKKFSFQD